jgi:hypothetical protein
VDLTNKYLADQFLFIAVLSLIDYVCLRRRLNFRILFGAFVGFLLLEVKIDRRTIFM